MFEMSEVFENREEICEEHGMGWVFLWSKRRHCMSIPSFSLPLFLHLNTLLQITYDFLRIYELRKRTVYELRSRQVH